MSYLPELRDALVEAARQRYRDAPEPHETRGRRRRPTAGGLAAACAALTAVAVAAVALLALGHHNTSPPTASSATVTRATLRRAAGQALDRLDLPRGAAVSRLMRGTPIELWSPSERLAIANGVDVYRVWRLPQPPNRVIEFIQAHGPRNNWLHGFIEEASSGEISNGAGGRPVITNAMTAIGLPTTRSGIWRQLAVDVVSLAGGGSELRVDSEAGWLMPRPASELIPPGVTRVEFYWFTNHGPRHMTVSVTEPRRVRALVSIFNTLPSAPPGRHPCKRDPGGFVSFEFEGRQGTAPLAIATWFLQCKKLGLEVAPRPAVPLVANFPTAGAGIAEALLVVLPPRRVSADSGQSGKTITHSTHASVAAVRH